MEVNGWLTALSQGDKTPDRRQKSSSCNATLYIVWSPEAVVSKVRALRIYQSVTSIKYVSMKFGQGAVSGVSEWVSDFFKDSGMWRLKHNGFGGQWKYSVKNIEELFRVCLKFSCFSLKSRKSSLTECWKEYLNNCLSQSCCPFPFYILLYISVIKQWFNLKVCIYRTYQDIYANCSLSWLQRAQSMKSSDVNFAGESCRFVCENDEDYKSVEII